MNSGSIDTQINFRLINLYNQHHDWLRSVSYNLCKNTDVADDLIGELYLYLAEKKNPKLFFSNSFNLKYCHLFLSSRWVNMVKRENKSIYVQNWKDTEDVPYNHEWDAMVDKFEQDVKDELDHLKTTPMWSSAKLYELYQFSDLTMEELSEEIGISKSTTFLNVKKIKQHLQNNIKNPKDEN